MSVGRRVVRKEVTDEGEEWDTKVETEAALVAAMYVL